jgi:phenylpropionate dioxygenase-like ring-hydroxylating dioxygenase large terminal subunit
VASAPGIDGRPAPCPGDAILDEWFPVAAAADLVPGSRHAFELLDERWLLVCGADGTPLVVRDTCPHRGAQLSLGSFDGERIACCYHGWEFGLDGRCLAQPAHPGRTPPAVAALRPVPLVVAYDLVWICVGASPRELPRYPAHAEHPGHTVLLGPKVLQATGPRIVENFLDMAHFPFVHAESLGRVPHTEVRDYGVAVVDGELRFSDCVFWQPNPGPRATEGGDVAYEYQVSHPYAAALTKIPSEADGGDLDGFSLLLITSPMSEFACRVWMLTTVRDPDADLAAFNAFNTIIFDQDIVTVESQRPRRLPLDPGAEVHQRADRGSLAYRRWLKDRGIRYGTSLNDPGGSP